MEQAVNNLEALFQQADVQLDYLSKQFQIDKDSGCPLSEEDNPVKLLAQVEEFKAEYSALTKEIAAIEAARKETLDYFQTSLPKLSNLLSRLEAPTGESETSKVVQAMYGELSLLMGVSDLNLPPQAPPATDDQQEKGSVSTKQAESSGKPGASVGKSKQKEPAASAVDRSRCSDFVAVTSEEFKSVSELVRGKVKLDDLNRTYSLLWQHFKIEGKKDALSPQEMNAMGLRVSGATGEAKLKVLRALKLCQISRNGSVTLC